MTACDQVSDRLESLAAGDAPADPAIAAHLATCASCAAALEEARRLERLLQTREVPKTPPQFTSRAMGTIRRDRWRREQAIDIGFNILVGLVSISIVLAVWLMLLRSGVAEASGQAVNLLTEQLVDIARRVAPSVPLYAGATALVGTALGIWWWAERDTI